MTFRPWLDAPPAEADTILVGGGFSGLLSLIHLRRLRPGVRAAVFERRPRRAPGVAYGACDAWHLLNVPAARMGATPDRPAAFHEWLEARSRGEFAPGEFVPRSLYGEYLNDLVGERLGEDHPGIALVRDAVVHIEHRAGELHALLESGRTCRAATAILAPGIPPGRAPWSDGLADAASSAPASLLVEDPWSEAASADLDRGADVLVIGSGLTAIDAVLSLRARGHEGHITLVSRSGRLPLPHAEAHGSPPSLAAADLRRGPLDLVHQLRRVAREHEASGGAWQSIIDAIRPHIPAIWRGWDEHDRRVFLKHLRPFWEIHRHRAPRSVLATIEALRREGRLSVVRGRLVRATPLSPRLADATIATIHGERRFAAGRVYNCIGPTTSLHDTADPLIASLLRTGTATTDELGLGLRCDDDGRLLDAQGSASDRLFLVGALRRGDLWESTAVPELRTQALRAAESAAAWLAETHRRDRETNGRALVEERTSVGGGRPPGR